MNLTLTRILVPVDFSAASLQAVDYGVALAEKLGASVELLHVVEDPIASGAWGPEIYVTSVPDLIRELEEDAAHRLAELKRGTSATAVPIDTRVATGSPARSIVAVARSEQCGLIVMGTHGRTGWPHLLVGSVAERVMRTAPCPVLAMRPAKIAQPKAVATAADAVAS